MIKSIQAKIALGVASAMVVGLMGAAAFAQTATLGVACAGVVSTNMITWTATATGGTAPYQYAWGGTVSGTSSVETVTYSATGTYQALVTVNDSASGTAATATTTCSAVVATLPSAADTVAPSIPAGLTANAVSASQINLGWSASTDNVGVAGYKVFRAGTQIATTTATSFSNTGLPASTNYVYAVAAFDAAGNVSGQSVSANATTQASSVTPPPTPAPTSTPRFQQPMLNINPGGHFMARGMIVTSVGTNSFQGTVWGITYTVNVNVTNNVQGDEPEFLLRGKGGGKFDLTQVKVGDELGVQGKIDASTPFVVTAQVVRDYSIVQLRPKHQESDGQNNDNNESNHGKNGSSSDEIKGQIQKFLEQLKGLQGKMKEHGNENGNH